MKTLISIVFLLLVAAAAVVVVMHIKQSDRERIGAETTTAITDAAHAGQEAAAEVATNVAADVKMGVQKAGVVATNVATKIKEVTTNTVGEVEEKIHNATR